MTSSPARRDHGWWPYLVPYFTFLVLGELQSRLSPESGAWFRIGRVLLVASLVAYFVRRGAYPELRGYPRDLRRIVADVAVGLAGVVLWVAPYLLIPWLPRPGPETAFDPNALGEGVRPLVLAARFFGFALVTPVMEELFIRSFLIRVVDVYGAGGDFRKVPIGRYTAWSFWIVLGAFTLSHMPWEWPVAVAWCALANLWLYRQRHIVSVIVLHAATNAGLLLLVLAADAWGWNLWWFV